MNRKLSLAILLCLCITSFFSCSKEKNDEPNNNSTINTDNGGGSNIVVDTKPSTSGTFGGYSYVDLGLPSGTLWATCNVGASSPYKTGGFYAWGETATKSDYTSDTYKYGTKSSNPNFSATIYTKYTITEQYYSTTQKQAPDNITSLELADDAAYVNMGTNWCMPTKDQCSELYSKCKVSSTTIEGVIGYSFIGPNGKMLFVPKAGYMYGTTKYSADHLFWSNTLYDDMNASLAWGGKVGSTGRSQGIQIRAVARTNTSNGGSTGGGTEGGGTSGGGSGTDNLGVTASMTKSLYTTVYIKLTRPSTASAISKTKITVGSKVYSGTWLASATAKTMEIYGLEPNYSGTATVSHYNSSGTELSSQTIAISTQKISATNYALIYSCSGGDEEYYTLTEMAEGVTPYLDDVSTAKHYYNKYVYFKGTDFLLRMYINYPYYSVPTSTWSSGSYEIVDTDETGAHFFNYIKGLIKTRNISTYTNMEVGTVFKKSVSGSITTYTVTGYTLNTPSQKVFLHALAQ